MSLFGAATALQPADCVVKLGVARLELGPLYELLTEVTVECSRSEAWTGRLVFSSYRDETGAWAVQDAASVRVWEPAVVEAAFETGTEPVLDGYVRDVRADYPRDAGAATVTVELQDASIALDREHRRTAHGDDTAPTDDSLIVRQIAGEHALALQEPVGSGRSNLQLVQDGTDIAFLRDRAEANGYELYFAPDGMYFGPPRMASAVQPTIMVYAGRDTNCVSLSTWVDAHAPEEVGFDIVDPSQPAAKPVTVSPDLQALGPQPATGGGPGLKPFVWRLARAGGADEAELTALAQQRVNAESLRVHADGELDGSLYGHVLRVGARVGVDGVGDTFNGTWYVDRVTHRFDDDGYRQSFSLLRNALGDNLTSNPDPLGSLR